MKISIFGMSFVKLFDSFIVIVLVILKIIVISNNS